MTVFMIKSLFESCTQPNRSTTGSVRNESRLTLSESSLVHSTLINSGTKQVNCLYEKINESFVQKLNNSRTKQVNAF